MSGNDEYCTPPEYIELARKLLGTIDLDPAANLIAQEYIQAKQFYTKENDGLALPWYGNVWLNPPYSYPLVQRFTEKAIEFAHSDAKGQVLLLTNACTDAKWFQNLLDFPACFMQGRISFYLDGKQVNGNRNGQVFFYLGTKNRLFIRLFRGLGRVIPSAY